MIDSEALNELCESFNLLDYISERNDVKLIGGRHYMICPFHSERTPSMLINEHSYKCFGCGESGRAIDYLKKAENLTFGEAVNKLQKLTGKPLTLESSSQAVKFFKTLRQTVKKQEQRQVIESFRCESFADEIPDEWVNEGILSEVMKEYGVKIDKVSNRIVYPVHDTEGNLISYKGRTRFASFKEIGIPKYQFYSKIGVLDFFVGWQQALPYIQESKTVYIFEGVKSVMHVRPWGYKNSISSETSHLSDEQIKLLIKSHISNVIICYDSDVDIKTVVENTKMLRKFCSVYYMKDKDKVLGEKCSPCDLGLEVFQKLDKEKIKI